MKHKIFIYILLTVFISSCYLKKDYVRVERPPHGKNVPDKNGSYKINGDRYYPISSSSGFVQFGEASWYGDKFHGRKTANGEVYDMHSKSAAHKILPFNTYVKVLNLSNNKYTIVRINDRGPFKKGRIIDLSYAAAKEIDIVGPGVAKVKIIALRKDQIDPGIKEGIFTIQVGAFGEQANAERLAEKLGILFDYINITEYKDENNKRYYRLHVSKSYTLDSATEIEKKLEDMGFTEAFIVRL
ncbi:MAG: septal ring lytic transglycosylase RlpA family protein [Desulfobacteraceae bacterium]|jgi:rare lipoprotein A